MVDVFAPKSCRLVMRMLLKQKTLVSEKQLVGQTGVSKGLCSRVMNELIARGAVKRPYRTRFALEYPEKLLLDWIGNRRIAAKKTFFARDASALRKVEHAHTLFSGAWLDARYLKSDFVTVYVKPDFAPQAQMAYLQEGVLGDWKTKTALIVAEDEFVFYGARRMGGERVVNPFLLYVDLASFGGIAFTALRQVAEKHGFPSLQTSG